MEVIKEECNVDKLLNAANGIVGRLAQQFEYKANGVEPPEDFVMITEKDQEQLVKIIDKIPKLLELKKALDKSEPVPVTDTPTTKDIIEEITTTKKKKTIPVQMDGNVFEHVIKQVKNGSSRV